MSFLTEYKSVQTILRDHHQVVVYAESSHYHQYFTSLLDDIINNSSLQILYITSDKNDPLLHTSFERIQVVFIKQFLGLLFPKIRADMMIMTMPDLNNFLFRRSALIRKYIYVFHAAVSTHLQYREKAFFHYDAIFCTGPYQERELRASEKIYGLQAKELIQYGYPLLDTIKKRFNTLPALGAGARQRILVAPSWFESCIFETCIEPLVSELSKLKHQIYIRSHPEYIKRLPKRYKALKKMAGKLSNVYFDESRDVIGAIIEADILVTDRSGIAFEYAFGTYRPVLFVDTSLKISNPNWQKLTMEPIENALRSRMGVSILPTEISGIAQKLDLLMSSRENYKTSLPELEKQVFFNSPQAYKQGLNYILGNMIRD